MEEIRKTYYNYITNLINYFEIKNINEFRESIASHINNPPNMKDEIDIKSWYDYLSKIIFSYSMLDEIEIQKRYAKELSIVCDLAKENSNA